MSAKAALRLLALSNTRIICADVGSAEDISPQLRSILSRADVLGFDADGDECARLNASGSPVRHINAPIGREGEIVRFELHRSRTNSSCYPFAFDRLAHFVEDLRRYETESVIEWKTRSLDSILHEAGIPRLDYVKADIEGHELAVFEGYSGPLLLAESEVYFHPERIGMPLFDRVMAHMTARGMMLLDVRRTYWRPLGIADPDATHEKGLLANGDALFALDPFLERNQVQMRDSATLGRYLALLCLYGYRSLALLTVGLVNPPNGDQIIATINAGFKREWFHLHRLSRLLGAIEKHMHIRGPIALYSGLTTGRRVWRDGPLGN